MMMMMMMIPSVGENVSYLSTTVFNIDLTAETTLTPGIDDTGDGENREGSPCRVYAVNTRQRATQLT